MFKSKKHDHLNITPIKIFLIEFQEGNRDKTDFLDRYQIDLLCYNFTLKEREKS
jgi:hypothetical protein